MYIYIYMLDTIYSYVYIYIHTSLSLYIYIYIYIYMQVVQGADCLLAGLRAAKAARGPPPSVGEGGSAPKRGRHSTICFILGEDSASQVPICAAAA